MNHELIMLRECKRMKQLSQVLTKEAKYKAIKSHLSQNVRNGTIGQIEEICRVIQLRDECLLFWRAAADGLNAMDCGDRLLLARYYLQRMDVQAVADKYGASVSTVYRRLHNARRQFKECLVKFGYNETWFKNTFGHIDFIAERLCA